MPSTAVFLGEFYNFPWKAGSPGRGGGALRPSRGSVPPSPGQSSPPPPPARPLPCPDSRPVVHLPVPHPGPWTCKELLPRGHFPSSWNTIYLPECRALTVLCDMDTDGGGDRELPGVPEMAPWPVGSGGHIWEAPLVGDQSLEAFVRLCNPRLRLAPSCH